MNKVDCRASIHLALFTLVVIVLGNVHGANAGPFFVFGSSYADTGNVRNPDSARPYPWKKPYGETWPGTPSGRYSNGHVLTDVMATALALSSPISFSQRVPGTKYAAGLNFAIGGSGVLTAYGFPSMSAQIDSFQSVVYSYTKEELASAVVLYATAGDDYLYYLTVQNAPLSGIYPLTVNVGKQISTDLIRLYQLGLRKFAVTYLPPTGCLPFATASNFFRSCNDSYSTNVAQPHNARVFKNVLGLKHYFTNGTIVLLDLYSAFLGSQQTIQPCCAGTTPGKKCSDVDGAGLPLYSVCTNPGSKFYWDDLIHPTEAGWQSVVQLLQSSLSQLK